MIVIVMGVSGSGKSTVGSEIARVLDWQFLDADELHSPEHLAKMAAGRPLTDADRGPWLEAIRALIASWIAAGEDGVIACSALRRSYRDTLRSGDVGSGHVGRGHVGGGQADALIRIVYLDVAYEVLTARVTVRHGHFMPATLLDSQLATLEPPAPDEHVITVRVGADATPAQTAATAVAALRADSSS